MHLKTLASRGGFEPRQMASSLRQHNYRLYFSGQLVSVAGTWMQTVAQSFLVLGCWPPPSPCWPARTPSRCGWSMSSR
ncbi:MAG TPA: hypothetical protein VK586_24835 [Streptosporangiaceae bacterium]|nr:hypothetical protein [Streptosporangiaceae bacterium]